jgi:predicted DNA-binding WGR domain protein
VKYWLAIDISQDVVAVTRPPPRNGLHPYNSNQAISWLRERQQNGTLASLQTCLPKVEELGLLVMETYLEKHDFDKNLARYYGMSVHPNLYGEWTLQREWGRIGQGGRIRLDLFRSEAEGERAVSVMEGVKERSAYQQVRH